MIYAEIELINQADLVAAQKKLLGEEEVKQIRVKMLVDTGSILLAINETIQEYLQLPVAYRQRFRLAHDQAEEIDVVGPVKVRFGNRISICNAILLPGNSEPLLGAIPMEEMDLLIDPFNQELIANPELRRGRYL